MTNVLCRADVSRINPWFSFQPESLGVTFGDAKDSWGFLIREMKPYPSQGTSIISNDVKPLLIPLFALYCPDTKHQCIDDRSSKNSKPMLQKMIEASGAADDPLGFCMEKIFKPLYKCWSDVLLKTGIVLEAHGQNTLLELDPLTLTPLRLVFRDFDTYVNQDLLEGNGYSAAAYGFTQDKLFRSAGTAGMPQGCPVSLVFDQAMKHPLDQIANLLFSAYSIQPMTIQGACRDYMKTACQEVAAYFPAGGTVYNYDTSAEATAARINHSVTNIVATNDSLLWR